MIAIKDFEIPKKCIWDCPFCNGEGGACELADIKTSDINRPLDCPLVEVDDNKIIKIPEKATNGDVIKALFGAEVIQKTNTWIETDIDGNTVFNLRWWNSPYDKEQTDGKID